MVTILYLYLYLYSYLKKYLTPSLVANDIPCSFENWVYDKSKVDLQPGSKSVSLKGYHKHGIWKLVGTRSFREEMELGLEAGDKRVYPAVKFELQLKRKSRYYVVNMMVPCAFLTLIALLVYNLVFF